jgi:asparagine synthase (glutamine-hydrolysing)
MLPVVHAAGAFATMCGISAVISYGCDDGSARAALERAHQALAHRGPDGEGFLWVDRAGQATRSERPARGGFADPGNPMLGIAFRQLKIHDLGTAALQPLVSADAASWIVLNGEIYNGDELRADLSAKGHVFRTRVDTEAVLAAYREWGVSCFERFNGMWALLIVDLRRRVLVGSRDRLGIKPLCYAVDHERIVFASEPQAVVRARRDPAAADPHRFHEFLIGIPPQAAGRTFFDGVRMVPAASSFEIDLRSEQPREPVFRRFWDLRDFVAADDRGSTFDVAVDNTRRLLQSSVALQSAAAVPIGCLLSGGVDSSFVARTLANRALADGAGAVPAYSITFRDPDMSELPFIWSVVRDGGLDSQTFELSPDRAWRDVDRVVCLQGAPLLGQDVIAQYHAYRLAREHGSIVVLEGQGADELLAGVPLYARARAAELAADGKIGELAREVWAQSRRESRSRGAALVRSAAIVRQLRSFGEPRRRRPDWIDGDMPSTRSDDEDWTPSRDPSLLNRYLFRAVTQTNLPAVLQLQDLSSMAHGIESRVPFLDHRFVEFCFTLPSTYKVLRGRRKRVVVEAARGVVPAAVLARRDKKRLVSKTHWMPLREHHAEALRDIASSTTMRNAPWFRRDRLAAFVDGYLHRRHDDVLSIWRIYTASRWLALFQVRS